MEGEYKIKLKPDAKPFVLTSPRRVPIPLLPKVKAELARMVDLGVITPVDEPTEWCSGMVVVPKPNGTVRICVDLTKLNESVEREKHQLPAIDQTLGQLAGAKVFSKLDANSGFWQIELSPESAKLTTFITPFGRHFFRRLPFGISSAPEHYQKRMSKALDGLDGVVCQTDDILVYGADQEEHDARLKIVLETLENKGITLNGEKCQFSKSEIKFVGHIINGNGVQADPARVRAIVEMEPPTDVSGVRRFLGMVNQLGKFSPNLAEKTKPLRDLLKKENQWIWDSPQQQAFTDIKQELSKSPVLALYDVNRKTTISADASSYGIGAVLMQEQDNGVLRPVAFASRSLTQTEQRYAQIEKEALSLTWACERFSDFIIGMEFHLETDHKPLVPLLGTKHLSELPIRIQRFRMRLMRYSFTISHVPGKQLNIADALSRQPVDIATNEDEQFSIETNVHIETVLASLPATESRLDQIRTETKSDQVLSQIMTYCIGNWPSEKNKVQELTRPYWNIRGELTVINGLLFKGERIVIPASMRQEILEKLHEGHLGIVKCRDRAKSSVWWPGLATEIENLVTLCYKCAETRNDRAEPAIRTPFPERPWERVGTDLFQYNGSSYLLMVDYFSRFVEIARLESTSSSDIINHMKSIFSRHGIPDCVVSDNGPQYSSDIFASFAKEYSFEHVTSSPRYPQSNGEAERAVQTVKQLLRKNADPYMAMLVYRSTPLQNGYSPSELLMGRKLKTTLPVATEVLTPNWPYVETVKLREKQQRTDSEENYNETHRAKPLQGLNTGDKVYVKDLKLRGEVVTNVKTPRSYVVRTRKGKIRRNRRHLVTTSGPMDMEESLDFDQEENRVNQSAIDNHIQPCQPQEPPDPPNPPVVRTRSGRVSKPPDRLNL